jgi:membrane fusion protein (multidrug efflux system)
MSEENTQSNNKRRRLAIASLTGLLVLITIALFLLWLNVWRFEKKTKDAYVHGNQVIVTPQISGNITEVTVDDTDVVEEGQLLVSLDRIDRQIAFDSAKTQLANAVRHVASLYEEIGTLKAQLKQSKAELTKASQDYRHRKGVVDVGGVSVEEFEHAKAALISALSSYVGTQFALRKLLTQTENTTLETHPLVKGAGDALRQTFVDLSRCEVRAPVKGMVAMKTAQVGESVSPENPLMTLIPLDQVWINANFKETKLAKVRIGQKAEVYTDIYESGVIYHGEVIGMAAATGSVLSVLPPQNATGNWIKIVQRLPVRIKLDPIEVARYPLRLGLSTTAKIDISDTSGKRIPNVSPEKPLYSTPVFENQEKGVDEVIAEIIKKNGSFSFNVGEDGPNS